MAAFIIALEREVVENNNAIPSRPVTTMKSYNFVATVYCLSDILYHLSIKSYLPEVAKPQVSND